MKRQFGFVKVRYRGLAKNSGQIVTLFALANLWHSARSDYCLCWARNYARELGMVG